LDCAEPTALAAFWAALVGGEVAFSSGEFVAVKTDRIWLAAVRVPNYQPPSWPEDAVPKQMHLDLAVTTSTKRKLKRCGSGRTGYPNSQRRIAGECC